MLRKILFLSMAAAALFPVAAKNSNVLDIKHSITDNAIVFPESYEMDTQKLLEGWYLKNYTATDKRYKTSSDPATSDAVIMQRLAELPTAIDLPFNQIVRQYIDRYTKKGRAGVAAMLGLSNYYMPIFEQALEEAGLPLELKYLPVIESGLNPNAVSRMGATGLWQFMLSAAKGYNMEVNSLVDERRDPYVSSRKAAAFLKDLYDTYGDWSLVIAAYNCGPGNVNKALRRAGGNADSKDFWTIYPYLPSETRGYVPMFIAATYVMNYYPEHNISPVLPTKPLITDTVAVNSRVHFNQISKVLDIPIDELRILNPQFRTDVIPGTAKKPYMLILPSQQVHAYLMSEADIKNYDADKYARRVVAEPGKGSSALATDNEADEALAFVEAGDDVPAQEVIQNEADELLAEEIAEVKKSAARNKNNRSSSREGKNTYTHTVAQGESLADIAEKYGVTKSEIKIQNGLRREAVRVGQELRISTSANVAQQQPAPAKQTKSAASSTVSNNRTSTRTSASNSSSSSQQTTAKARNRNNNSASSQQTAQSSSSTKKNSKKQQQEQAQTSSKKSKKNQQQQEQAQTYSKKGKKNQKQQEQAQSSKKGKKNQKQQEQAQSSKKGKKNQKQEQAQTSSKKKNEHAIKEGESLSTISKKYGVSVDEIKAANGMKNDNIRAGKSLTIPKKKANAKSSSKKSDTKSSSKKSSKKRK